MNEFTSSNTKLTPDILPVANGRADRLPPMLFVSALLWAMLILGITFEAGVLANTGETMSLDVTIVAQTRDTLRPDRADYVAQANQQGNGNTTEKVRASAAREASSQPAPDADLQGPVQFETQTGTTTNKALLTSTASNQRIQQPDDAVDNADEAARLAQSPPTGSEATLPLPESDKPTLLITDDNPRHLVVSVNAAQSEIAPYLASWKQRVERIGSQYFNENRDTDGLYGSPMLAITINHDGTLGAATILRSSGTRALDQAAMVVVRRAAPYQAFPQHIREKHDLLSFEYTFVIEGSGVAGDLVH